MSTKFHPHLAERCAEVLQWQNTGILSGTHLIALANTFDEKTFGDFSSRLHRAERITEKEAATYAVLALETLGNIELMATGQVRKGLVTDGEMSAEQAHDLAEAHPLIQRIRELRV